MCAQAVHALFKAGFSVDAAAAALLCVSGHAEFGSGAGGAGAGAGGGQGKAAEAVLLALEGAGQVSLVMEMLGSAAHARELFGSARGMKMWMTYAATQARMGEVWAAAHAYGQTRTLEALQDGTHSASWDEGSQLWLMPRELAFLVEKWGTKRLRTAYAGVSASSLFVDMSAVEKPLRGDMHGFHSMIAVFLDEVGFLEAAVHHTGLSAVTGKNPAWVVDRQLFSTPVIFQDEASTVAHHDALVSAATRTGHRGMDAGKLHQFVESTESHFTLTPATMMIGYQGLADAAVLREIGHTYNRLWPNETHTEAAAIPTGGLVEPERGASMAMPPPDRRIRLGFVSSFFGEHTVGRLFDGVVHGVDRCRFEVHVVHTGHFLPASRGHGMRDALRKKTKVWCPASDADDHNAQKEEIAVADTWQSTGRDWRKARKVVRDLNLDILVYPEIGMDRFVLHMARQRLASVQVVLWGHPVSQGFDTIDFFVSSGLFEATPSSQCSPWGASSSSSLSNDPTAGIACSERSQRRREKMEHHDPATGSGDSGSAGGEKDERGDEVPDEASAISQLAENELMADAGVPLVAARAEQTVMFDSLAAFVARPERQAEEARTMTNSGDPQESTAIRTTLGIPQSAKVVLMPHTLMKFHPRMDAVVRALVVNDPNVHVVITYAPSQSIWRNMLEYRLRFGSASTLSHWYRATRHIASQLNQTSAVEQIKEVHEAAERSSFEECMHTRLSGSASPNQVWRCWLHELKITSTITTPTSVRSMAEAAEAAETEGTRTTVGGARAYASMLERESRNVEAMSRVLFVQTLPRDEFFSLVEASTAVVDSFPWGMGMTALETLAHGTPIVTLPVAQTVPRIVLGIYRRIADWRVDGSATATDTTMDDASDAVGGMRFLADMYTCCVASSIKELTQKTLRLARSEQYRSAVSASLDARIGERVYQDSAAQTEWNRFLLRIARSMGLGRGQ